MKKLILLWTAVLFGFGAMAYAAGGPVYKSSFTNTADTLAALCSTPSKLQTVHGLLHGVVVSSASPTTLSNVSIWTSTTIGVQYTTMTVIDTSNEGTYYFDAVASSTMSAALVYTKVGGATVQFLYDCY